MLRVTAVLHLAIMATLYSAADASSVVNSIDGLSEIIGHYVNIFQGQKERSPTKIKLAIVGLPRTGTGSLVEALTLLGYTTLHVDEYFELSYLFAALTDETDPMSMQDFTYKVGQRGFDAVYYWNQDFLRWAADSDDVKVILTARDSPKRWAESFQSVGTSWEKLLVSRPWIWIKQVRDMVPIFLSMNDVIQSDNMDTLQKSYVDHMELVHHIVPQEKLLVFNAKMGWEPLCEFLNADCGSRMDQPFPHANERWLLQLENNVAWIITWIWPLLILLFICMVWSVLHFVFKLAKKSKLKES